MSAKKTCSPIKYVAEWLHKHPGYIKHPIDSICALTGGSRSDVRSVVSAMRKERYPKAEIRISRNEYNNQSSKEKIKSIIRGKTKDVDITILANELDVSPKKINELLLELKNDGYNVKITESGASIHNVIPKSDDFYLTDISKNSKNFYEFGVCGDNHLCSRYERLDVLNSLYDIYEKEGIKKVLNTGNMIDGEARFNKNDLNVHGMDRQLDYLIANYPKRKGIITCFITGDDHEGWYVQSEGIDIGKYLEMRAINSGRNDLKFLGHMESDLVLPSKNGETRVRVLHPGGGSSYATSYTAQKIVESYSGGEKPNILLVGHYHKAEYTYVRGVHVVQTGTTEDQTPFMRKKRLAAHLGGWIVKFSADDNGAVVRFNPEFFPFYDRAYYNKLWEYKK